MSRYTPEEKVKIARDPGRPGTADFINALFTDFFEQRGDRLYGEDPSIRHGHRPPEGEKPGGEPALQLRNALP